jgi:hypothetical protein
MTSITKCVNNANFALKALHEI